MIYTMDMPIESKNNSFGNFRIGLFVADPPVPPGFDQMEDELGNVLHDSLGNILVAQN